MADFAPYQDIPPERHRALSPPPKSPPPRTARSPPVESHSRGGSRNIGTAAATSPTGQTGNNSANAAGSGDYFSPGQGWRYQDEEHGVGPRTASPDAGVVQGAARSGGWSSSGREHVDLFETRLGLRMDVEACLAYLLLPPVGGVLLLILEHKSDYVRFHAWQSSLLFSFTFILHVLFSWSAVLSWIILVGDLALIAWLTLRAYQDAATLDRYEVPFFGPLASSILDDE